MMDPKPGYITTEFWSTLFVHIITLVVMISTALGNDHFDGSNLESLIPVASMIASGIAQAYYSHARANVKNASLSAASQVVSTQVMSASTPPAPIEPTFDLTGPQD